MSTIKEISKLAGVSKSTVSRYLNNGSISPETAEKIRMVIEEHNYIPNSFAQSLKANKTSTIGIIIPNFIGFSKNISLTAIDKFFKENAYKILISNSNDNMEEEVKIIYSLANQKVDGIILFASEMTKEHYKAIKNVKIPVVVIGQEAKGVNYIVHDDYKAGSIIGKYIMETNHKKIAYFGVGSYDQSLMKRYNGLLDELKKNSSIMTNYYEVDFNFNTAYEKLKQVYNEDEFTYFVGATDNIAYGILKALRQLGKDIPNQVSVSGFGDYEMSQVVYPALTTVHFSYYEIGLVSAKTLLKLINGKKVSKRIVLDCKLEVRKSTKKIY